tara:strand:- start:2507 stop:3865 length:1359 start_codon:yes stop_codon:yes gene_type:complete
MPDLDKVLQTMPLSELIANAKLREGRQKGLSNPSRPRILLSDAPDPKVLSMLDREIKVTKENGKKKKTRGPLKRNRRNCYLIIQQDRRLGKRLWLDSFRETLRIDGRDYADTDDTRISLWISSVYGLSYGPTTIAEMSRLVGEENKRNELVEWLDNLAWDRTPRTDEWLIRAAGAVDSNLIRTVSRAWLVQAVARALNPGCKADTTLILIGPQGAKKSSLLRAMAGDDYFSDTPIDIGKTSAYIQIARAWIYEVAELDSIKRTATSATKAFLSATEDNYRPPYARHAITKKRHVCFCGSTNEATFLFDRTGSRRFWPVRVGKIDLKWAMDNREQLWAEAVHLYRRGATWWLEADDAEEMEDVSEIYQEIDPWVSMIDKWLRTTAHDILESSEILRSALHLDSQHMTASAAKRLSAAMVALGWEKQRRMHFGVRGYFWVKNTVILNLDLDVGE